MGETYTDIARLGEKIRPGTVSPTEVVDGCLERIEALDPKLNAFITVMADGDLCTASRSA